MTGVPLLRSESVCVPIMYSMNSVWLTQTCTVSNKNSTLSKFSAKMDKKEESMAEHRVLTF